MRSSFLDLTNAAHRLVRKRLKSTVPDFAPLRPKENGAYYTPDAVVSSLLQWAVRNDADRLLDPSCGDGRFIAGHGKSVGVEQDPGAAIIAMRRAPLARVHQADFFAWAAHTPERFDCATGNPPFIRYQTFKGETRKQALELCSRLGAEFTGLTSSWAPFLVAAASLLKPGGRLAFVVPAEIGHAPYSTPLLSYLVRNFATVHVIAIRDKLFPSLSEDCWLLYADGFGSHTAEIGFTSLERFGYRPTPPREQLKVPVSEWQAVWNRRLRPFLMPAAARDLYREVAQLTGTRRFGQIANIGIGYVTGANDFFHLRPSAARRWGIPDGLLQPSVRNSRSLPRIQLFPALVEQWRHADKPILLLRIAKEDTLPDGVRKYLNTEEGRVAREAYKCRTRDPWYSVPDVQIPDFFLTYMSGRTPSLVQNAAGCTCTNSLHGVRLKARAGHLNLIQLWRSPLVRLSCEIEGHPLGGGMLKLEPREATSILLPDAAATGRLDMTAAEDGISSMRSWRHCAS